MLTFHSTAELNEFAKTADGPFSAVFVVEHVRSAYVISVHNGRIVHMYWQRPHHSQAA